MRNIAILIVFSFVLISCEKEESEKEESLDIENPQLVIENTDIPLLSKMLSGGVIYHEFTYNDRNLLLEEKNKHHYSLHTYDDNNQLIASEIYWDKSSISSDIRVIEELANREEWVSPDNTPLRASHSFKYNTEEQLVNKTYIYHPQGNSVILEILYEDGRVVRSSSYRDGEISHYGDFTYDSDGNLTLEERYRYTPEGIAELQTTTEYEYDNMRNPYLAFKRLITPGKYTNQNNIVKETYTLHFEVDASIEKVQIREHSYEYNDDGYPVMVDGVTEYVYRD
jgi:hypothetical protein